MLDDWVNRVASQLEACAEELDDDQDSKILDLTGHGENALDELEKVLPLVSGVSVLSNETDQHHPPDRDAPLALPEIKIPQREASSISTLKDALSKSRADRKSNLDSLLKMTKDRSQVQFLLKNTKIARSRKVDRPTLSAATSLIYLTLVIAVLTIGATTVIRSCHYLWPMFGGKYFNLDVEYLHRLWDETWHLARDRIWR